MVEDRITDGKRIGQLLASELTGLQTGALADVEVVDADRSVSPEPEGAEAYRIAFSDEPVATVSLFPTCIEIHLVSGSWAHGSRGTELVDERTLRVHTGAAVKQVVDCLRSTLERE